MTEVEWSILVPTIAQREPLFLRLLGALLPQADEAAGAVEVVGYRNAGRPSLGVIRDSMLANARGKYVAFVDDDDMISEDYVSTVLPLLADDPDHVGFRMEYSEDGGEPEIVDHSLVHGRWHRAADSGILCRDFTHVDPIRRAHALRGRFAQAKPGRAEDRAWVKQVRPWLHTERYTDRILYRYLFRNDTTSWQRPERVAVSHDLNAGALPGIPSAAFRWHPDTV